MRYKTIIILLFLTNSLFRVETVAQKNQNIDSLKRIIQISKIDTSTINHYVSIGDYFKNQNQDSAEYYYNLGLQISKKHKLDVNQRIIYNKLAYLFYDQHDYEKAREYFHKELDICKQNNWIKEEANTLVNIGVAFHYDTYYEKAIEYMKMAIQLYDKLSMHEKKAKCHNRIGIGYRKLGDYEKAIDSYMSGLSIYEDIGDLNGIAASYTNIGIIYTILENLEKAIGYHQKSLTIKLEIQDSAGIANCYNNIGIIYSKQKNYTEALGNFQKSLELNKKLKKERKVALHYNNIALVYKRLGEYRNALDFFNNALEVNKKMNNKEGMVIVLGNIAEIYLLQKKYTHAQSFTEKALKISLENHLLLHEIKAYKVLSAINDSLRNYPLAYKYYQKFDNLEDSLFNLEKEKNLDHLQTKFETEQKEKEIALQKIELERRNQKINRTRTLLITLFVFLVVVVVFLIILYRFYIEREKKNKMLELRNEQIEQQKEELLAQNAEISQQKEEILTQRNQLEETNIKLQQLSIVASETRNAVIICDENGDFEWANRSYSTIYGFPPPQLSRSIKRSLVSFYNIPKQKIDKFSHSKETMVFQREATNKTGKKIIVQTSITPVFENNSLKKIIAIDTDITHIHEADLLKRELAISEQLNALKKQFLGNMGHEMRTPMNGILGMAELLKKADIQPQYKEIAEIVHSSSLNLMHVINEILEISQIGSGNINLDTQSFDLRRIIDRVKFLFQAPAKKKGLSIHIEETKEFAFEIISDKNRLMQILSYLVSNAIKFTESGHITIRYTYHEISEEDVELEISVEDTGIGIEDAQKEMIYKWFTQADGSSTRKYGGIGLGLTIAKELIKLLGGKLHLKSEVGKGSLFTFRFIAKLQK